MGEVATATTAAAAENSLNKLFGADLADTHNLIKVLRDAGYDHLLKTDFNNTDPASRRHGTLRFAAGLLAERIKFNQTQYPAAKFRDFLRWLTWLGDPSQHTAKKFQVTEITDDGTTVTNNVKTPAVPILKAMKKALPSTGRPKALSFKWTGVSSSDPFAVIIDYTDNKVTKIEVITVNSTGLTDADSEDDLPNPP